MRKTKITALGSANFINNEVHHEYMEVRDAQEGKEHCYTEKGEQISCPICGAIWLEETEGEFTSGGCQHLRFTLHSEGCDEFDFFGDWVQTDFLCQVKEAIENEDDADFIDILESLQCTDVDKAIQFIWRDDPQYQPWMLWGYKEN